MVFLRYTIPCLLTNHQSAKDRSEGIICHERCRGKPLKRGGNYRRTVKTTHHSTVKSHHRFIYYRGNHIEVQNLERGNYFIFSTTDS